MPAFTILCLLVAIMVETSLKLQLIMTSSIFLYLGLAIAVGTIIASFFHKLKEPLSYDVFACGILLAWFAYWKPLFVSGSPIFFFFPVYFALIVAFVSLFFIGQRHQIDRDSRTIMRKIVDSEVIEPWFIMTAVLVTLYFENHFMQFPVMMTLLIARYALFGCLLPYYKKTA